MIAGNAMSRVCVFVFPLVLVVGCGDDSASYNARPAEVAATSKSMVGAFNAFLINNKVEKGAIAVSYNGKQVKSFGRSRKASSPAKIASRSKAVTALCAMAALEDSGMKPSANFGEIIPSKLNKFSSRNPDFDRITVAQLITHSSGLHVPHVSQMGTRISSFNREQKSWQLKEFIQFGFAARPGSSYHYANSNYLLLGLVIEALTSLDYENYCNDKLLAPQGIATAKLSSNWGFRYLMLAKLFRVLPSMGWGHPCDAQMRVRCFGTMVPFHGSHPISMAISVPFLLFILRAMPCRLIILPMAMAGGRRR